MQDSLEDYIRLSKNAKEETNTISKEVLLTVQRKKECDIRAMKIVEFSIEGKLRPEIFIKCLPFINQSYYQDIVEERAITKLCGYSICGKKIPEMPKKQFHISTKSNKVYDITDRKNYCSNFCYKASLHIKKQIDNSPLWLRKHEDVPKYNFLDASEGGLPGEYIDQGIVKPVAEPTFMSVSLFTSASLEDVIKNEVGGEKVRAKVQAPKESRLQKSPMQTISEGMELVEDKVITENAKSDTNDVKNTKKKQYYEPKPVFTSDPASIADKTIGNKEPDSKIKNIAPVSETNIKKVKKKQTSKPIDVELLVQKVFKQWLTLDSYIFIHGESKVKGILNEKKLSDYFDLLNVAELQREQQVKYMQICKRLQVQEMADEKFDNALIGNSKLSPLPDYQQLKDDNKDLTLKVKSFYSGVLHEKEDTNFPTKVNKVNEDKDEDGPPAVLPLVDVSSQNALRRKVFLTSINKSMQQTLQALRVPSFNSVLSDLQCFVRTFNLKADNVIFKPIVWHYIAVVFLHILSVRDANIKNILEEKQSQAYLDLQLSSLPNRNKLVSDVMVLIENIDMFLESYISSSSSDRIK